MCGIRPTNFYETLKRQPGVRLVHPSVTSRKLLEKCAMVGTVTGTVGLEAYLLNKPCMIFGPTFFDHLCIQAPDTFYFRDFFESIVSTWQPPSDRDKAIELAKLINISGDFSIEDPFYVRTVMSESNIKSARFHFWKHIGRLQLALNKHH